MLLRASALILSLLHIAAAADNVPSIAEILDKQWPVDVNTRVYLSGEQTDGGVSYLECAGMSVRNPKLLRCTLTVKSGLYSKSEVTKQCRGIFPIRTELLVNENIRALTVVRIDDNSNSEADEPLKLHVIDVETCLTKSVGRFIQPYGRYYKVMPDNGRFDTFVESAGPGVGATFYQQSYRPISDNELSVQTLPFLPNVSLVQPEIFRQEKFYAYLAVSHEADAVRIFMVNPGNPFKEVSLPRSDGKNYSIDAAIFNNERLSILWQDQLGRYGYTQFDQGLKARRDVTLLGSEAPQDYQYKYNLNDGGLLLWRETEANDYGVGSIVRVAVNGTRRAVIEYEDELGQFEPVGERLLRVYRRSGNYCFLHCRSLRGRNGVQDKVVRCRDKCIERAAIEM